MNEDARLEVVLAANFQKALTAIQSTNTELKNTVMLVKNVKANFDGTGNMKSFSISAQAMRQTESSTKSLNSSLSRTQKILSTGFNLGKLYLLWNVTKRIRDAFVGMIEKSVDFIETTNKFEVAMGDAADKAYSFQRRLSESFGTLTTDMMNFQATFKNIMSAIPRIN